MSDTEQMLAVHADGQVCAAHKEMVTERRFMWVIGTILSAFVLIGAFWRSGTVTTDALAAVQVNTAGQIAIIDARSSRNEKDIAAMRKETLELLRRIEDKVDKR